MRVVSGRNSVISKPIRTSKYQRHRHRHPPFHTPLDLTAPIHPSIHPFPSIYLFIHPFIFLLFNPVQSVTYIYDPLIYLPIHPFFLSFLIRSSICPPPIYLQPINLLIHPLITHPSTIIHLFFVSSIHPAFLHSISTHSPICPSVQPFTNLSNYPLIQH